MLKNLVQLMLRCSKNHRLKSREVDQVKLNLVMQKGNQAFLLFSAPQFIFFPNSTKRLLYCKFCQTSTPLFHLDTVVTYSNLYQHALSELLNVISEVKCLFTTE